MISGSCSDVPADRGALAALPGLIVFRTTLYEPSEAFILTQADKCTHFRVYLAGVRGGRAAQRPAHRTFTLSDGSGVGRIRDLGFKLTSWSPMLTAWLRRVQPQLVLAHFGPDATLILPTVRQLGIPLVTYFHGFDATMSDEYARRSFFLHRRYLRQRPTLQQEGRLFLAVSNFVRQRLVEQGFPAQRTHVVALGVDTDFFSPGEETAREPVILFVGRLSPEKLAEHAIRAAREVQRLRPEVELVLVGDGPERKTAERLAQTLGCRCRFLGMLPQAQVRDWMRRAAIICVPSVALPSGEQEGFGLVAAEAQACALPVVGYHTGGLGEAVSSGETGLLLPPGDLDGLARALEHLLNDSGTRRGMGLEGVARTRRLFNLATQVGVLEDLLAQTVLESRSWRGGAAPCAASSA